MQINKFFRILNKIIEKYDKMASNPFYNVKIPITLIWIEDQNDSSDKNVT